MARITDYPSSDINGSEVFVVESDEGTKSLGIDKLAEYVGNGSTPGTSPSVDSTLSVSGRAADAKVVGDVLATMNESIGDLDGRVSTIERIGAPGTGVSVDKTLTRTGYAADAKVVGDKLSKVNEDFNNHENRIKTLENNGGGQGGNGEQGGSNGIPTAFITAIQNLFYGVVVWDDTKVPNPKQAIADLSNYASGGGTVTPDEPDEPTQNGVTVSWSGTTASINNLKNTTISYSGNVATVGV